MKKILVLFCLFFAGTSLAQYSTATIKLGHFNPSASDGGFIIGYEGGKAIDQNLTFGWSLDWFHKNYVDRTLVNNFDQFNGGIGGSINELRAKTNIHDFPFMLNLTGKFPVAPFTKIFLTGGVGAEILLISYSNYQNPDEDEMQAAFDFNWRVGIGALYELGRSADVLFQLDYHASHPSWEYEVEDAGRKRTFERTFDMSGVMFRLGFRFYY